MTYRTSMEGRKESLPHVSEKCSSVVKRDFNMLFFSFAGNMVNGWFPSSSSFINPPPPFDKRFPIHPPCSLKTSWRKFHHSMDSANVCDCRVRALYKPDHKMYCMQNCRAIILNGRNKIAKDQMDVEGEEFLPFILLLVCCSTTRRLVIGNSY